ncbi:MAG: ParB/RepB/Spo0J family partition protein [Candidatus Omnitrophica bacterium]|nr:ParB/RepB/Spo0J family partition protein [Candidatus Omnitrophota bacterium]
MERKALGRGISALIPEKEEIKDKIVFIPIEQIKPNPFQPRQDFNEEKIQQLAQSIKEKGLIQPVLVRKKGGYYELIAGERRVRALKLLNINEIPAIIREAEDKSLLELSLIENIQREDLNPIEEAKAYQYLMEKFAITQEELAQIMGKARTTLANILRLLKLPLEIQEEIKKGSISYGHARALIEIEDLQLQKTLVKEIIEKGLSVRELENLIRNKRRPKKLLKKTETPEIILWQEELQHHLGTKVKIELKKKRGKILIEFYSLEDLKRIIKKIKAEDESGNFNSD